MFRDNRMIAVCQYNSMPGEDMVLMRHYLRKHDIHVKFFLNEVGAELPGQILVVLGMEAGGSGAGLAGGKLHFKRCLCRLSGPSCPSPSTRTSSLSSWRAISCW